MNLPDDLLEEIAMHIPLNQITKYMLVSRRFADVVNRESFWTNRLAKDYPGMQPIALQTHQNCYKDCHTVNIWGSSLSHRAVVKVFRPIKSRKAGNRVFVARFDGKLSCYSDLGDDCSVKKPESLKDISLSKKVCLGLDVRPDPAASPVRRPQFTFSIYGHLNARTIWL